jgi:hypothetical protein
MKPGKDWDLFQSRLALAVKREAMDVKLKKDAEHKRALRSERASDSSSKPRINNQMNNQMVRTRPQRLTLRS